MVYEYTADCSGKLRAWNLFDDTDGVYHVPLSVYNEKAYDEDDYGIGNVPILYGNDGGLSFDDAIWIDQSSGRADFNLRIRRTHGILDTERLF